MYYCPVCKNLYSDQAKNFIPINVHGTDMGYECPIRSCGGIVIDIDEHMIPICNALQDAGYPTIFSCAGHVFSVYKGTDIYVMVSGDITDVVAHVPLPKGFRHFVNYETREDLTTRGIMTSEITSDIHAPWIRTNEHDEISLQIMINNYINQFCKWAMKVRDYVDEQRNEVAHRRRK